MINITPATALIIIDSIIFALFLVCLVKLATILGKVIKAHKNHQPQLEIGGQLLSVNAKLIRTVAFAFVCFVVWTAWFSISVLNAFCF